MSYDIKLVDSKTNEPLEVENHEEGGTYQVGGTTGATLNVTYNYSQFYYDTVNKDKGIRWLYGRKGKECVEKLNEAVKLLGTDRYTALDKGEYILDYWTPTPGNAGYALNILLTWAKQHPEGVFDGD